MRVHAIVSAMVLAAASAVPARAQTLQKIEVTPFVGWETSGSYPVDLTANPSSDVQAFRADANRTFGFTLDYLLGDDFAAEFLWADNATTYSAQSVATGAWTEAFPSHISQYQFGGLYYARDRTKALRPYLVGSLGFTHDGNGGGNAGRTAFGFGVGGGVRYRLASHFALRTEARWMPTYGSSGLGTICDSGYGGDYLGYGIGDYCYNGTVHNYLQRFHFDIGITIRP